MNTHKKFQGSINGKITFENDKVITKHFSNFGNSLRFERELSFYRYCEETLNPFVPKIFEVNENLQYIKMQNLGSGFLEESDTGYVNQFTKFLHSLNQEQHSSERSRYPFKGKEACFSNSDIYDHCSSRIIDISEGKCSNTFKSLSEKYFSLLSYPQPAKAFDIRCLNPSDNGMHNCVKVNERYFFIDFEYSGIDTFEKVYYDFILHPANNLKFEDYQRILKIFNKNIKICKIKFDVNIFKNFCIFWILRLINSTTEKVISERLSNGNIEHADVDDYLRERLKNIRRFEEKFNHV